MAHLCGRTSLIVLPCPWVALGPVGGGCGELLGVKAGDGGAWCHCDGAVTVSCEYARDKGHQLSTLGACDLLYEPREEMGRRATTFGAVAMVQGHVRQSRPTWLGERKPGPSPSDCDHRADCSTPQTYPSRAKPSLPRSHSRYYSHSIIQKAT
jgi:hypothetical protein